MVKIRKISTLTLHVVLSFQRITKEKLLTFVKRSVVILFPSETTKNSGITQSKSILKTIVLFNVILAGCYFNDKPQMKKCI
jgi:hypothetical protein